jgi:hypothetical protein
VKRSQKPNTCGHQHRFREVTGVTYWFGEHVKNGVGDDLGIGADHMTTLRETPDAVMCQ